MKKRKRIELVTVTSFTPKITSSGTLPTSEETAKMRRYRNLEMARSGYRKHVNIKL